MDAFNFLNFLKNPGLLHQVTFQEINNLIEQYPFCQNLHYLALRKAQNEDHKDFFKKLELAATYSPNRQWLYKQLKETEVPAAISDETEEAAILDLSEEDSAPSGLSIVEEPSILEEEQLAPISGGVPANNAEDLEENTTEETPVSIQNTAIPSHSISDSETEAPSLPADDIDTNLENPEDMKLPDDKHKRVIYMEDLVEEMPPLEENPDLISPVESEEDDSPFVDAPSGEDGEEAPEESVEAPAVEEERKAYNPIPFEIYDNRNLPVEELEDELESNSLDVESSEAEIISDVETNLDEENSEEEDYLEIPETEHRMDEVVEQADQEMSPSESIETNPILAMKNEEDDNEIDDEDLFEEDPVGEEETEDEEPPTVAPLPKSAFSSWRQSKPAISSIVKKKKKKGKKKKTEQVSVLNVNDLFKADKKKKKTKKKKKKKNTRGFAMESLLEHEDVISETLAEIIAEQGAKKKAIKMYKRLMKMHPEKYAIYLNRIQELSKD